MNEHDAAEQAYSNGYSAGYVAGRRSVGERKRGQWEYWAGGLRKCPVCGHEYTDYLECYNFCGNCGADMRGTEDGK